MTDHWEVVRPVCIFLLAMAVAAVAMAMKGWGPISLELGAIVVGMGAVAVLRVHHGMAAATTRSKRMQDAAAEAESHYTDVLTRIVEYSEARDQFWKGHSTNVGVLSEKIARKLHLPPEQCRLMNLAGRLHDIGTLAVPEGLRMSPTRLAATEFRTMKRHVEASYEMLRPLRSIASVLPAVRHHHERMNGTGYPDGLKGEDVPMLARIIAVADSYDAMTHDRPHRPAMTPLQAMMELRRCSPSGYDARCVEALAEVVNLPDLQETLPSRGQAKDGAAAVR